MGFESAYPWTHLNRPLVVSAPMMNISLGDYALATSSAGGLGFLAGGFDLSTLHSRLQDARDTLFAPITPMGAMRTPFPDLARRQAHDKALLLPIGVGVQNWGADLEVFIEAITAIPVAAVWFFAPNNIRDLDEWTTRVRAVSPQTQVWIQIGTVAEALAVAVNGGSSSSTRPDVLVVQGRDAGGHGLAERAGIITLLPEVKDALARHGQSHIPLIAAGGIMDARGAAATLCLGADGVCLGTRLLASDEAVVARGYQDEILRAADGGVSTVGSTVYDAVRGIRGWPSAYHGRGLINQTLIDAQAGMDPEENERLYREEMKKGGDQGWGVDGRMTTYAGTGVGLVTSVKPIRDIVREIHGAVELLGSTMQRWSSSSTD